MRSHFKFLLSLAFTVIAVSSIAQNRITIALDDFNALKVSGRIDVELILSDSKEMSITSLMDQPEDVKVAVKEGELKISIPPKFKTKNKISVKLPYKSLSRIESLAGAVINSARDLETDKLVLSVATGGKIELSINVISVDVKVTQVSDIILYGKAESQNVKVNTGGNYLAYDLDCKDSYVIASAGSQAMVTASRVINARANSKGFIGYIGDPESTFTKITLGGEIASFKNRPLN